MALTADCVDQHIGSWQASLATTRRPYRKHWPGFLFHHAPLENALRILEDGFIRSRNDPENSKPRDIAGLGVITNQLDAHDRVRLYFRPRTPTQYNIEGIRRAADCKYFTQAPILVFFVLGARDILLDQDILISDRNMQRNDKNVGSDDAFFATVPFSKVYHDGPLDGDVSITSHRCAEALSSHPIDLAQHLKGIWFRSAPERDTLLHLLGEHRRKWTHLCNLSEELKIFEKRFAFVDSIDLTTEGVVFRLNARNDSTDLAVRIEAFSVDGVKVIDFYNSGMAAYPPNSQRWIVKQPLETGLYSVKVHIDDQLAYDSVIDLGASLF